MNIQNVALEGANAELFDPINALDGDAIMEVFSGDALVDDIQHEFWGKLEIRGGVDRETVEQVAAVEILDAAEHDGLTIVLGIRGTSQIAGPLVLNYHATVSADTGKIANLIIIDNGSVR